MVNKTWFFCVVFRGNFSRPSQEETGKTLRIGWDFYVCVCVCTLECWSNRLRERASGSNPSDLIYLFRWFPFMISFVHLVVFFVRFFFGLDSSRHNLHKKKKKRSSWFKSSSFWPGSSIENHWATPPIHLPQLLSKVVPPQSHTPSIFTQWRKNLADWMSLVITLGFKFSLFFFFLFTKHIEISNFFKYYY
jgi:hypothetical protein